MSRTIKRRYKQTRQEFKRDLYEVVKDNRAFAMLIIETYAAQKHKYHIMKVWELLGFYHKEAYRDYCDKLMGKHLTGRHEIMRSLYFADKNLHEKYWRRIPERYAMGDALGIAYRVLKSNK
ncbi:hypothetical protein [Priestia aryabhattai]|uniref:hypothetical protein n=1 Tax=Priestia aryabhattai TaxID=412384 RepID=UPI0023AF2299|nr:hypothetical protein [Priestia aryabhattai]MDE8676479.1 hypothetical protein [Priestia aryabhattai]